ncbi:HNH endonuclease [Chryseobacterium lathyri]|uniref:HNH endonuclease n=1 Tax=Chryseobacterium lathyri TaxID=395933 RepID=UPI002780A1C1|nr:HNH endonuclease [Chryseobacterium lathyri]MDQ0064255.1 hypothetical protein [Chryseobacterium lathyri]
MIDEGLKIDLYKEQDGKCIYCNKDYPIKDLIFDHIFPRSFSDTSDNHIVLTCYKCNDYKSNRKPFNEFEFVNFLKELIENSDDYNSVSSESVLDGNSLFKADLLVEKVDGTKLLLEVKSFPTYTNNRLQDIINQIKTYVEISKDYKGVFVFPGKLSENSNKLLKDQDIEVWDIDFIIQNFSKQIENSSFKLLKKIFGFHNNIDEPQELIISLKSILPGKKDWSKYQKHLGTILSFLFGDSLSDPIYERPDKMKINRRDFILRNYEESGFWKYIRDRYQADFIVVDAKNYEKGIKKQEILQISNYLKSHGTGLFAIIISRNGLENTSSYYTRREIWVTEKKMIIILSDIDIENMILAKANSNKPDEIIKQKIEQFRLEM